MNGFPRPGSEDCSFALSNGPGGLKQVDYTRPNGAKVLGLYEIMGDTLKLAFPKAGSDERPASMKAVVGSGTLVLTLKRDK